MAQVRTLDLKIPHSIWKSEACHMYIFYPKLWTKEEICVSILSWNKFLYYKIIIKGSYNMMGNPNSNTNSRGMGSSYGTMSQALSPNVTTQPTQPPAESSSQPASSTLPNVIAQPAQPLAAANDQNEHTPFLASPSTEQQNPQEESPNYMPCAAFGGVASAALALAGIFASAMGSPAGGVVGILGCGGLVVSGGYAGCRRFNNNDSHAQEPTYYRYQPNR